MHAEAAPLATSSEPVTNESTTPVKNDEDAQPEDSGSTAPGNSEVLVNTESTPESDASTESETNTDADDGEVVHIDDENQMAAGFSSGGGARGGSVGGSSGGSRGSSGSSWGSGSRSGGGYYGGSSRSGAGKKMAHFGVALASLVLSLYA